MSIKCGLAALAVVTSRSPEAGLWHMLRDATRGKACWQADCRLSVSKRLVSRHFVAEILALLGQDVVQF